MEYVVENLGISSSTYRRWEHGKGKPNRSHLRKLCDFFQLKPEELGYTEILEQSQ